MQGFEATTQMLTDKATSGYEPATLTFNQALWIIASGATVSSEGAQLVCRLPLAALLLWTSDFQSRRPAAVMQYEDQSLSRGS